MCYKPRTSSLATDRLPPGYRAAWDDNFGTGRLSLRTGVLSLRTITFTLDAVLAAGCGEALAQANPKGGSECSKW
jgi:hypothetical protein